MSARKLRFSISTCAAILTLIVYAGSVARIYSAEGDPEPPSAGDGAAAGPSDAANGNLNLSIEQAKLADKFKDLERVLLRMAQVTEASDPKRAALLRQVFVQSKEKQVGLQFEDLVKLLQQEQLYQASKGQTAVQQDLNRLLELLLTGDRDKQIPNERAEIKKFIERINKLIREEQGLQGETEGQGDPLELAKRQEGIGKKTQELEQELKKFDDRNKPAGEESKADGSDAAPDEKADGESKPDDGKPGEKPDGKAGGKSDESDADKSGDQKSDQPDGDKSAKKPDDKQDSDDKKSDQPSDEKKNDEKSADDRKPADKSDSKSSEKSDGKSSDSEKSPSESQSKGGKSQQKSQQQQGQQQKQSEESDSESESQQQNSEQQDSDESQARRRIREAQERMQEAKRRLEQAKRRGAAEEEQKAIDALQQAKAELEEILRQLREEEIERTLAMLEGRFRKMLQMQIEVYEGTVRLDRVPEDQRDRDIEIEAAKLSRREAEITAEADKALNLLREEGSSAAFPEAVDQMREDMETVTGRLARANVGQLTQGIEQDIVKALEEMIASLQKAQKEAQKRRGGGGGGGGGGEQDQALVDQIAELKMIRALQLRVNTRTQRYSRMLDEGVEHAEQPDLVEAVRRLSEREERIYKTTRDIVVGRNK